MYTRSILPSKRSYFLLGPRGTGKTTWLRDTYSQAIWYDLLKPSEYLRLSRQPEVFRQEIEALPKNSTIVVDEVQKLPLLLDDVQYFLAQTRKGHHFILTGSSARKLKRQGNNLLAGRASHRMLFPLILDEYQDFRNFDEILKFGTLPEVLGIKSPDEKIEFLESYASLYLKEEVLQEGAIRNLDPFARFLSVAALMNGQLINAASLARDSGIGRSTISGFYQVLIDTLVGFHLESWRPKLRIKETTHPKFYFFDPGVVRSLNGRLRSELDDLEKGYLFETYIIHELRAWRSYKGLNFSITFWRTPSKVEVDLVLESEGQKVGIEIKSSKVWKKEFGKPLKGLLETKDIHRAFGIYQGERPLKDGQLEVLPIKDFLKRLYSNQLF